VTGRQSLSTSVLSTDTPIIECHVAFSRIPRQHAHCGNCRQEVGRPLLFSLATRPLWVQPQTSRMRRSIGHSIWRPRHEEAFMQPTERLQSLWTIQMYRKTHVVVEHTTFGSRSPQVRRRTAGAQPASCEPSLDFGASTIIRGMSTI